MALAETINRAVRKVPVWPLYIVGAIPPVWLFSEGVTGALGPDPTKVIEHQMGLWGLQLLIATLSISVIRNYGRINLIRFRRALGRLAFAYIFLHLLVWLVLDVQIPSEIWRDITKRPYITVGMLGFALLIPLASTSSDYAIRKMGAAAWRRLHTLVYPAVLLGGVHYLMLVKSWQLQPMAYLGIITVILATKIRDRKRQRA